MFDPKKKTGFLDAIDGDVWLGVALLCLCLVWVAVVLFLRGWADRWDGFSLMYWDFVKTVGSSELASGLCDLLYCY